MIIKNKKGVNLIELSVSMLLITLILGVLTTITVRTARNAFIVKEGMSHANQISDVLDYIYQAKDVALEVNVASDNKSITMICTDKVIHLEFIDKMIVLGGKEICPVDEKSAVYIQDEKVSINIFTKQHTPILLDFYL